MMLCALSAWHAGPSQVVVAGEPAADGTRALKGELARHYLPFAIVVPVAPGTAQAELAQLVPLLAAMSMLDRRATAYVCRDFSCRQPVATAEDLDRELSAAS